MDFPGREAVRNPVVAIAVAAILFGLATPVLKLLLSAITPVMLVALLSLGSGGGVLCWLAACRLANRSVPFRLKLPALHGKDLYWLAITTVVGGMAAPLVQSASLAMTPAAVAALLLNFEIVWTILIALLMFNEPVDRKTGIALALVVAGSILLSWNGDSAIGFSAGAAGIVLSCLLWGIDNNAMARISALPSSSVVVIKGLCGGGLACVLVVLLHEPFPGWVPVVLAVATGFLSFGGGLVLFIYALRTMGAARAGAVYAAAPFIGCIASLLIFAESPGNLFWVALPLFLAGALIIVYEQWTGRDRSP